MQILEQFYGTSWYPLHQLQLCIVLRHRWNRNIKTKKACFTSDTTYIFMVVIFGLGIYKTDMCVQKQLSVYTQECAVYKISWGGWAGWGGVGVVGGSGFYPPWKIKQKGFCPKKGFCPSCKIYRRDFVHLVKKSGGIMSTLQKTWEGLCPPIQK